jgi:hypothetical protein
MYMYISNTPLVHFGYMQFSPVSFTLIKMGVGETALLKNKLPSESKKLSNWDVD